jgi:hypothetical protein
VRRRRVLSGLASLLLGWALPACTPLFVPPIPTSTLEPAPVWRVAGDAEARVVETAEGDVRLRARVRFESVPADAWVAVQWFGPSGGERASSSLWVSRVDEDRWLAWDLPADVPVVPGAWRSLLSVDGRPLRQLDVLVGDEALVDDDDRVDEDDDP